MKLITKQLEKRFKELGNKECENNPIVVAKYFNQVSIGICSVSIVGHWKNMEWNIPGISIRNSFLGWSVCRFVHIRNETGENFEFIFRISYFNRLPGINRINLLQHRTADKGDWFTKSFGCFSNSNCNYAHKGILNVGHVGKYHSLASGILFYE